MDLSQAFLYTALGTGFTFLMTTLGASFVFLVGKKPSYRVQTISLGFAAGVMIAASVWSLLLPAIEQAESMGNTAWISAAGGFLAGALFLFALDKLMPHLHPGSRDPEGPKTKMKRSSLLFLAVTLHNIPEGMSVGLAFGLAGLNGDAVSLSAAIALAIGIGIQNIPEGTAVALPLAQEGFSRQKAFVYGMLSGLVEPICGLLVVAAIGFIAPFMPWLLAFAAGAMIYVVVEELIPAAHLNEHSDYGTLSVIIGFIVMMVLDVALG